MADTDNRTGGSADLSQADIPSNNILTTLVPAEAAASGSLQFNLPIDSNDISNVEIVDLDLVIVGKNGERFLLPQAALQATLSPDKAIAKFKGGVNVPLADQFKKVGIVKPVEGGSYRIEATTIKPVPGVSDKLGFEFNLGKEGDEVKAQEKIEQLAAKVEQISKSLQTASLSKSEAVTGKGPGEGPGQGPGTGKTTTAAASDIATPGAPPNDKKTFKLEDYTYKVPEQPVQNKPILVSTAEGKLSNLSYGDKKTDFGEIEVRRLLSEKPLQVNVIGGGKVQPLEVSKVSADLKMQWQPSASKLILSLVKNDAGLPSDFKVPGFKVNKQDFTSVTSLDILPGNTSIQRIRLSWNAVDDIQTEIPTQQFKLIANFVDANGVSITTTEIKFSYGDFKTLAQTSDVDTLYLFARGMSYAINGTDGVDNVNAGSGHDVVFGNAGDDSLVGGQGDDTIDGGIGSDTLDGGSGNDTASYAKNTSGVKVQLDSDNNEEGGATGDTLINIENLIGSDYNDVLKGNSQDNMINAGNGNDTVYGGGGADTLDGGQGINTISYQESTNTEGIKINLALHTNAGGDANDDVLSNFTHVVATTYADFIVGDSQNNMLYGLDGNDTIYGAEGDDSLYGGKGNDTLAGGAGRDLIDGGGDIANNNEHNLVTYKDSSSAIKIDLSNASVQQGGDAEGDKLIRIQDVMGSAFNDSITGSDESNSLAGGAGNDTLSGGGGLGRDTLDGGDGIDTADFSLDGIVFVTLGNEGANDTTTDQDVLISIENIIGSNYSDKLTGNKENNVIEGKIGSDSLFGKEGNDTLVGGAGNDTLDGGLGADWLYGDEINTTNGSGQTNTVTYANSAKGVSVYLDTSMGDTYGGDADGDRLFNIQNLTGSAYNDTLAGDSGNNSLLGGDGNDIFIAGTESQYGVDTLIGGSGNDSVIWNELPTNGTALSVVNLLANGSIGNRFKSIQTLDFSKDNVNSNIVLSAEGVKAIADAGDNPEITLKLGINDKYSFATGSTYTIQDNKIIFTDASANIIAKVNIDQINPPNNVDPTLQEQASRHVYHSSEFKVSNVSLVDQSLQLTKIKPNLLLQQNPLAVNATGHNVYVKTANDLVIMDLALPGLATADKVVLSLAQGSHALPEGFGFYNVTDFVKFGPSVTSIELPADGIKVLRLKMCWNPIADTDTNFTPFDFQLKVDFYSSNVYVQPNYSSRLADPITFRFGDYRNTTDINIPDDSKGNTVLYLPARGISYAINGTADNDTIYGGVGHDVIKGGSGNDSLIGGAGDDSLVGGEGRDTLDGGSGNNTVSYQDSSAAVAVKLAWDRTGSTSGQGTGGTADGDVLQNIQNITGGLGNDLLVGNNEKNQLLGGEGNDTLEGGLGADTLDGGAGAGDAVSYENALSILKNGAALGVTIDLQNQINNQGADAVGDILLNIENIIGSKFNDDLRGNAKANALFGGLGDDTLEGGLGADTLSGGSDSNDNNNTVSYIHSDADISTGIATGVKVYLDGSKSNEGVYAQGDVFIRIKNAIGTYFDDVLVGNNDANILSGMKGNDLLIGGIGADTLDGGEGIDTASYENIASNTGVSASLKAPNTNTGEAFGDTYTNIENIIGSKNNDTLEGNDAANTLTGNGGNDMFYASGGGDSFIATAGTDSTVSYEKLNENVTAYLDASKANSNTGAASGDRYTNIKNLTGSYTNANKLYGNDEDNVLVGGNLDDTMSGAGGKDAFYGGAGNDTVTYADTSSSEGVTVSLVQGGSSGVANGDSFSSIEIIIGTKNNDNITGNVEANTLYGGDGNDTLRGGGGSDSLDGGDGDDVFKNSGSGTHYYAGGNGNNTVSFEDVKSSGVAIDLMNQTSDNGEGGTEILTQINNLIGSAGNDYLAGNDDDNFIQGASGNDTLYGAAGADRLEGGNGDDALLGGAGSDTLIGGEGLDTVSYAKSTQSITLNLSSNTQSNDFNPSLNNDAYRDTFESVEKFIGSDFNDTFVIGGDKTDYVYDGGAGTDTLNFSQSTAGVNVDLYNTATRATGGFAQGASFANFEYIVGSNYNDTLSGDAIGTNNSIVGGSGNDTIFVTTGYDTLDGGADNDTLDFSKISSSITVDLNQTTFTVTTPGSGSYKQNFSNFENTNGTGGNDNITGNAAANSLAGGAGNDTINGGSGGADTLDGGEGDDFFIRSNTFTGTSIAGGAGTDTVDYSDASFNKIAITVNLNNNQATFDNKVDSIFTVENVIFNSGNDKYIGSSTDTAGNSIVGGAGNDTLTGGAGNDKLFGDFNDSTGSTVGVSYNDTLDGGAGNDSLYGGFGDDLLLSSAGADNFEGGDGTDVVSYASSSGSGVNNTLVIDTTQTSLGMGKGTGDALGDVIGMDVEKITGSDNASTYFYVAARDNATIYEGNSLQSNTVDYFWVTTTDPNKYSNFDSNYLLTADLRNTDPLTTTKNAGDASNNYYTNINNLVGSSFNDKLIGNPFNNAISGGAGNDRIYVGSGQDTLDGGEGTDLITFEYMGPTSGSTIGYTMVLSESTQTLQNFISSNVVNFYYKNFEGIVGSSANDFLTGNTKDNYLEGGAGNDNLYGGDGNDTLVGGLGADLFNGGNGKDVVDYSSAKTALVISLDNITRGSSSSEAYGDTFNSIETVFGSTANSNTVYGSLIAETVYGGNFSATSTGVGDTFFSSAGADTFYGGLGFDTVDYSTSTTAVNLQFTNSIIATSNTAYVKDFFVKTGMTASNTTYTFAYGSDASRESADTLVNLTNTNNSPSAWWLTYKSYGNSLNTNSNANDYGDTFKNIETVIGSNNNDVMRVTDGTNTTGITGGWGMTFFAKYGADSLYGAGGNDTFDFTKQTVSSGGNYTADTLAGHHMTDNLGVGGAGGDVFVMNEVDMLSVSGTTTTSRAFKIWGDAENASLGSTGITSFDPGFQTSPTTSGATYDLKNFKNIDEVRINAWATNPSATATTTSGKKQLELSKFLGQLDHIEKIDISGDGVASNITLSASLIQGLADNKSNSTIILKLSNSTSVGDGVSVALTDGAYYASSTATTTTTAATSNITYSMLGSASGLAKVDYYEFKLGANVVAKAFVEYV